MGQFMDPEFFHLAFGRCQIGGQVRIAHMGLPQFTGLPVFVEDEKSGVFIVLMEIVLNATGFGTGDGDQLQQLGFYEFNGRCCTTQRR